MESALIIEKSKIPNHLLKFFEPIKDNSRTMGSAMPTSVTDRLNQTHEHFYFFTKSKKYYSNLNAVRIPNQVVGVTDMHPNGHIRRRELQYDSKYLKDYSPQFKQSNVRFNYRVRDAVRKAGQPQFKASEEEITSYIARKYGYDPEGICPACGRKWKRHASPNSKDRKEGLRREFIPCIKLEEYHGKFKGMEQDAEMFGSPRARNERQNKVNDPRGNHFGGPGSWRDFKDEHKSFTHSKGKNLPSCWLIGSEPHNFSKELGTGGTEHFASFPQSLVQIPVLFGSAKGDTVLDPFCGTATVGLVAHNLNRKFIGIELSQDYIDHIIIPRLELNTSQLTIDF